MPKEGGPGQKEGGLGNARGCAVFAMGKPVCLQLCFATGCAHLAPGLRPQKVCFVFPGALGKQKFHALRQRVGVQLGQGDGPVAGLGVPRIRAHEFVQQAA